MCVKVGFKKGGAWLQIAPAELSPPKKEQNDNAGRGSEATAGDRDANAFKLQEQGRQAMEELGGWWGWV